MFTRIDRFRRCYGARSLGIAGGLLIAALPFSVASAAARDSGFQATSSMGRALVSKDVNGQRWAMSYDRRTGVITGNVFPTDGGLPKFVVCGVLSSDAQGGIDAECTGADACTSCPCASGWTQLGTVTLPVGFFELCDTAATTRFKVEAWADNWFAMYVDGALVLKDSVPITTERSFNSETGYFDGTYPLQLAFVLKDFKQDDTGLEYIGTPQQQMGDGGFIVQLTDQATGSAVAVSDATWKCKVIHRGPLNPACEKDPDPETTCLHESEDEPAGWREPGYDFSGWENATEFGADAVGPKAGYFDISWDARAQFVWSSSLEQDNTVLCRVTVRG